MIISVFKTGRGTHPGVGGFEDGGRGHLELEKGSKAILTSILQKGMYLLTPCF